MIFRFLDVVELRVSLNPTAYNNGKRDCKRDFDGSVEGLFSVDSQAHPAHPWLPVLSLADSSQ